MKIDEKVACVGGSHFWKCWGRNRFGEELKILDFALGGGTAPERHYGEIEVLLPGYVVIWLTESIDYFW